MKTLLLIRHARSEQATSKADFDRPLSSRGKKDAAAMAAWLKEKELIPDLLAASPAKRARQTARRMAQEWGYEEKNIAWKEELYGAGLPVYYEMITAVPDQYNCVAVVGHNPVIGLLADFLTISSIRQFPPCCIAAFGILADSWEDFSTAAKELLFINFPRETA